jgi:anaerobic dimethyl sulfoxide reductase subunit B (iron-sulfur subunit)
MSKQYGFYVDTDKCVGCNTCRVACKDFYDLDLGQNYRRVLDYEGGNWTKRDNGWLPEVFAYYVSISCNHCSDPACVSGCPTGAMHKREEDGLVVVNQDVCVGCRYCEMRCPYGAPQFDHKKKVMSKCHGCFDRVAAGKLPICVQSCPQRALDFGPMEELRARYQGSADVAPLPSPEITKPNIIIAGNKNLRPSSDRTGNLQNKNEIL